jgi:hypothetical protein
MKVICYVYHGLTPYHKFFLIDIYPYTHVGTNKRYKGFPGYEGNKGELLHPLSPPNNHKITVSGFPLLHRIIFEVSRAIIKPFIGPAVHPTTTGEDLSRFEIPQKQTDFIFEKIKRGKGPAFLARDHPITGIIFRAYAVTLRTNNFLHVNRLLILG